jgi:hypothetical protein
MATQHGGSFSSGLAESFHSHSTDIRILPDTAMLQAKGQGPLIQSNETDAFDSLQRES